jgi:TolB-like protein
MNKSNCVITGLLIVVLLFSTSTAAQVKKVAVLPFQMNSPEKLDYLRDGVWDMLMSRIEVTNKIEVIGKPSVIDALERVKKKQLAEPDVLTLGQDLKVDYVVWGSITKIGENVSLDGKLLDVTAKKSAVSVFEQSRGLNEVIPKINDFAKKIDQHILGDVPASFAAAPAAPVNVLPVGPAAAAGGAAAASSGVKGVPQSEAEVISGMRKGRGTFTAAINPDFIHSGRPDDRRGFWMSPKYGTEFRGMDIGDVNKDGLNEVVIIDVYNVMIYQKKGNEFILLNKIAGKKNDIYLAVDIADINGNGIPEIFVTNYVYDHLESFVLEYRDGKYERIASDLRWFLRVINTGENPVLMGQELSLDTSGQATGSFITDSRMAFQNPIHEVVWSNGKYREGQRMKIPQGLPVYGLTLDTVEPGKPERVICLDDFDYLRVYEKTEKLLIKLNVFGGAPEFLYKSDDHYGGSNTYFEIPKAGSGSSFYTAQDLIPYYVNLRIIAYDTNKDGKKELILVKNISATGDVMSRMKLFTSSEVYNLEWDGIGFLENWKTRKINGYVADYQVKDIDNDGQDEIVMALVLSVGATIKSNSVVVSYKLLATQP